MVQIVTIGIVVVAGILILVFWGWVAALVYAFLAGVAAVSMWALGLAGRITRELSSGRFARRVR